MFIEFDDLLPMYKKICFEHVETLFYTYNSIYNPNNHQKNKRKIELLFEDNNVVNAYAYIDAKDNIKMELEMLREIHACIYKFISNSNSRYSDIENNLVAMYFFFIASKFLISHEFFHLYSGHCDLLNYKSKKIVKLNAEYSDDYAISYLDYQTLEMNADCGAMCRTVDTILNRSFYHDQVWSLIHERENAIEYALLAINMLFFILRGKKKPIYNSNYKDMTHHPLLMRQIMNHNTFKKYIFTEYNIVISDIFLRESFATSELIFNTMEGNIFEGNEAYKKNLDEEQILYEERLRNNWTVIKEELSPYTRSPHAEFS